MSLPAGETVHTTQHASPSIDDFASLLGSRFQVDTESAGRIMVELSEVIHDKHATPAKFRQPFSLVFKMTSPERLPQDVYTVAHPKLGSMQLLLVPVDLPEKHNNLQAVFG